MLPNISPLNGTFWRSTSHPDQNHTYKYPQPLFKSLNFVSVEIQYMSNRIVLLFLQVLRSFLFKGREIWGISSLSWGILQSLIFSCLQSYKAWWPLPGTPVGYPCFVPSPQFSSSCSNIRETVFLEALLSGRPQKPQGLRKAIEQRHVKGEANSKVLEPSPLIFRLLDTSFPVQISVGAKRSGQAPFSWPL